MDQSEENQLPTTQNKAVEPVTLKSIFAPVKLDIDKMMIHGHVASGICFVQCAVTGHCSSFRVKGNESLVKIIEDLTKKTAEWKSNQLKKSRSQHPKAKSK